MSVSVEGGMEKSRLAPCLSLHRRGLLHLWALLRLRMGSRDGATLVISPLGFWKGSARGLSPSPSPVSRLDLENACQVILAGLPHCCSFIFLMQSAW